VYTIGHQHQATDAFGSRLLGCQITQGLLVLGVASKGGDSTAWLEVKAGARAHQIIGAGSVAQAQVLAFFQHTEWWRRITHHIIVVALELLVGQSFIEHSA